MGSRRFLLIVASCLVTKAALGQEYTSEELDRLIMANIRHLCEWSKTTAPEGNPVVVSACQPGGDSNLAKAEKENNAWWQWWKENDEATFFRLNTEWDAELKRTNAKYEADRKAAAQKRAKVARERFVASIPSMTVPDLCKAIRGGKTPEALEELVKRKTFPASETALIAGRQINLGMSERAMLCALGSPKRSNRSVGTWGVHIQYVYDGAIVYVENGKVSSWQD